MLSLFPVGKPIKLILLVGVPLLVLSMAVCGLLCWLRTKRQHRPLVEHETSMLKVPCGGDPTYGVMLGDIHCFLFDLIIIISLICNELVNEIELKTSVS